MSVYMSAHKLIAMLTSACVSFQMFHVMPAKSGLMMSISTRMALLPASFTGSDSFLAFGLDFAFLFSCSSASKHQSQCHTYGPMAMLQRAIAEDLQVSVSTSSTRQARSQTFTLLQCFYLPQHVCQHPKWLREPFRQRSPDELHIC